MASKRRNIWAGSAFCLVSLAAVACSPSPRFYLRYGNQFAQSDLEGILADNPLPATENYKVVTLGKAQEVSHHVVQIRDREVPHIHKDHDLTVVLLKGRGYLMLEKKKIDLTAGDVLFVPRSVVHYFVNAAAEPAVALAVFSPAFDGKDTIPLKIP